MDKTLLKIRSEILKEVIDDLLKDPTNEELIRLFEEYVRFIRSELHAR